MKSQLLAIITYRDLSALSTSRVPKTLHVYGPDQYIRPEQMNQVDISNYCWTVVPNIDRIDFSEYYRQLPRNREEMKVIEHAELPAVTDYIPHSQIAQVKLELYPPDSQQVATIWVVLVSGKIYCTTCFVVVPGKGIEGDFELLEQPSTGESKQAESVPQYPSKENGYNRGLHGGDERAYAGNLGQSALVVKAKRTDLYRDGGTAEYQGTDNNTYYVWRPTGAVYRDQKHRVHCPDLIIEDMDDGTQYTWNGKHSPYHSIKDPRLARMDQAFVVDRKKGTIEPVSDEAKCPYSRGEVLCYAKEPWPHKLIVVTKVDADFIYYQALSSFGELKGEPNGVVWKNNQKLKTTRLFYYFEADTSTGFSTDDPNHDAALIAAHG